MRSRKTFFVALETHLELEHRCGSTWVHSYKVQVPAQVV